MTELSLIYAIVAVAIYLTYQIMDFCDLTVEGSFALGGCIFVTSYNAGFGLLISLLLTCIGGALAGFITGFLTKKFDISGILSSILTMTSLYSINMRILNGSNVPLIRDIDINLLTLATIVAIIYSALFFMLKCKFGLKLRASGMNPFAANRYKIKEALFLVFSIMLSNVLIAFAGGLFAIKQGFGDVSMGMGTLISGLAAIIIGKQLTFVKIPILFRCFFGALLYRLIVELTLDTAFIGLLPSDFNLVSSFVVILCLLLSKKGKSNDYNYKFAL